jgi:hypothetical protein
MSLWKSSMHLRRVWLAVRIREHYAPCLIAGVLLLSGVCGAQTDEVASDPAQV